MTEEGTMHKVAHMFEVDIDETDEEDKERHYQASCRQLTGCVVYASSRAKALRKIRQAIDVWLDLANRQCENDPQDIEERLDMAIPD